MAKTYEFHLRLDKNTRDVMLRSAAKEQNTDNPNVSEYLRNLVMNHGRSMTKELAMEIHAVKNQIIRVGNNLNQMARVANETGKLPEQETFLDEIAKLNDAMDQIREQINVKLSDN